MSAVIAANAVSAVLFAVLVALALLAARRLPRYAHPLRFLAIAFFVVALVEVSNILERVAAFSAIDRFEEYEEILILPFVLLFVHSWTSARRLERSEAYLRELHHRVKNNLQIVESILSLAEGEAARGGEGGQGLRAARTRIEVIGLAEKMALDSSPPGFVEMDTCLGEILSRIVESFGEPGGGCAIECGRLVLPSARALPCGLIAAEALMAAGAAPSSGGKSLAISLGAKPDGRAELRFEGFPPFGKGLPAALAEAFMRQLDARACGDEACLAFEFDLAAPETGDFPEGLPAEPARRGESRGQAGSGR